ncbi:MAG: hypothetical protein HND57_09015 [Planctomycetes bacterium]|nr:hypothetical protein [Planctomycetota bacterium]
MREFRNTILIVGLFLFFGWAFWAWFWNPQISREWLLANKALSAGLFVVTGLVLIWALKFEDKLPDLLAHYTGGIYYEQNGLCFMPVMRKEGDRAFLCIYYENRYENACDAIVHIRPPKQAIQHRPDAYDMRFAFQCGGGAVGVIQQPVAVHPKLQGQVIDVQIAAAVNFPHNRGDQVRSHRGMPCGTFEVDWGVNFRTGMHELSGEIELLEPVSVHLPIPRGVSNRIRAGQHWRQQLLSAADQPHKNT